MVTPSYVLFFFYLGKSYHIAIPFALMSGEWCFLIRISGVTALTRIPRQLHSCCLLWHSVHHQLCMLAMGWQWVLRLSRRRSECPDRRWRAVLHDCRSTLLAPRGRHGTLLDVRSRPPLRTSGSPCIDIVTNCIALHRKSISELWSITCHMVSQCYLMPDRQNRPVLSLPNPEVEGWVDKIVFVILRCFTCLQTVNLSKCQPLDGGLTWLEVEPMTSQSQV